VATFIAIGGFAREPRAHQTMMKRLVQETGKRNARVLYIPTDGGEVLGYWPSFEETMSRLGCTSSPLFLLRDPSSRKQMKSLVDKADLIFVGGGNTLRMMRMWRRFGFDRHLVQAAKTNKVFAGVSAGAICWFEYGHSDSRSFSGKKDWKYVRVRGLGLRKGTFCPHVLGEKRLANFAAMMEKIGGDGYGVNDGSALLIKNGSCEVIGNRGGAYRVTRNAVDQLPSHFKWP
jgi:dipeptidase E